MATLPCDRHRSPQPGRLCGAYLALLTDGKRLGKYRRLCVNCCQDVLMAHATDWLDNALKRDQDLLSNCTACGLVVNGNGSLARFYATVYPNGRDRRDYTAAYCRECASKIATEFEIDG